MAFLPRPVTTMMWSMPEATHSSTTYWIRGLSTSGSISLGMALVAGRKRVPRPAAGNTALRTLGIMLGQLYGRLGGTRRSGAARTPGERDPAEPKTKPDNALSDQSLSIRWRCEVSMIVLGVEAGSCGGWGLLKQIHHGLRDCRTLHWNQR